MKYKFSKLIFVPVTLIILFSILYIGFSEGLIKFEDNSLKMFKTENILCSISHDPTGICEFKLFNGSFIKLKQGDSLLLNNYNMFKVNLVNYGSLLLLCLGLLLNHYLYNKDYDFKGEINKLK